MVQFKYGLLEVDSMSLTQHPISYVWLFGLMAYQPLMVILYQIRFNIYIYIWFVSEWFFDNFIFKEVRAHLLAHS